MNHFGWFAYPRFWRPHPGPVSQCVKQYRKPSLHNQEGHLCKLGVSVRLQCALRKAWSFKSLSGDRLWKLRQSRKNESRLAAATLHFKTRNHETRQSSPKTLIFKVPPPCLPSSSRMRIFQVPHSLRPTFVLMLTDVLNQRGPKFNLAIVIIDPISDGPVRPSSWIKTLSWSVFHHPPLILIRATSSAYALLCLSIKAICSE